MKSHLIEVPGFVVAKTVIGISSNSKREVILGFETKRKLIYCG